MDHGIQDGTLIEEQENVVEPIVIGDDVWIVAGVKVLRGSTLRNHCVIGANAVVKGDIPDSGIAVGIPAKIVKYRK